MTPTMTQIPILDWKTVDVGDVLTFQVPPDTTEEIVQPIDSVVGILNGPGYQTVYDYGRYGEPVKAYRDRSDFQSLARQIDGRPASQVSFLNAEESPKWPTVHILQVTDYKASNTFTLRISCVDPETCQVADSVFGSVSFR